jgi:hypothetical protein
MRWMPIAWMIASVACGGDDAAPDAPDAPVEPSGGWVVANVTRPDGTPLLATFVYDRSTLAVACPEQTVTTAYKYLAAHPSLPYVYGVDTALTGIALACAGATSSPGATLGQTRAIRLRIVLASDAIGFFTIRNDITRESLWRFTIGSDGVPTVQEEVHSGPNTGALAIDVPVKQIFTGSLRAIFEYPLAGDSLVLPPTYKAHTTSCTSTVDIALSGDYALAFCSDVGEIQRFTRTPLAPDGTVGAIGVMDRVIAIPGDRAIGARSTPPALVTIALGGGTPTWVDGPALGSPITAMAVSRDASTLFTARPVDAATSELASWQISADAITLIATQTIAGTVVALAETAPGT